MLSKQIWITFVFHGVCHPSPQVPVCGPGVPTTNPFHITRLVFQSANSGCDNSRSCVPARYANIMFWYSIVFSHVGRRNFCICVVRTVYLLFAGTIRPFLSKGIQYRKLVGICVYGIKNVGADCLYMQLCFLF